MTAPKTASDCSTGNCDTGDTCTCLPAGTVPLGGTCADNAECDPNESELGVLCCSGAAACGANDGQCVENCSTFSSGGIVRINVGETCQDNTQCGAGLFCCLVPGVNCDFDLDQSCSCQTTPP